MRFTLKNPRSLQYIDYQNVRKTEFLGCQSQEHLKGISDADIVGLNIPTATPYVFEFDDDLNLVKDYYLADPEELKRKQEAVAKQGKAK